MLDGKLQTLQGVLRRHDAAGAVGHDAHRLCPVHHIVKAEADERREQQEQHQREDHQQHMPSITAALGAGGPLDREIPGVLQVAAGEAQHKAGAGNQAQHIEHEAAVQDDKGADRAINDDVEVRVGIVSVHHRFGIHPVVAGQGGTLCLQAVHRELLQEACGEEDQQQHHKRERHGRDKVFPVLFPPGQSFSSSFSRAARTPQRPPSVSARRAGRRAA